MLGGSLAAITNVLVAFATSLGLLVQDLTKSNPFERAFPSLHQSLALELGSTFPPRWSAKIHCNHEHTPKILSDRRRNSR
ncbi:hypothetical protein V8E36_009492 [Tilletia maclaganii]